MRAVCANAPVGAVPELEAAVWFESSGCCGSSYDFLVELFFHPEAC